MKQEIIKGSFEYGDFEYDYTITIYDDSEHRADLIEIETDDEASRTYYEQYPVQIEELALDHAYRQRK